MSFVFTGPKVPLGPYLDSLREQAIKDQDPEYKGEINNTLKLMYEFIDQEPKFYVGFMLLIALANGQTMGELSREHGYHREFMIREIAKTKAFIRRKMFFRTKGEVK